MMRVFTATLGTETNSFSPIPTGLASFASAMLWRPGAHPDFPTEATGPLWVCRKLARERGWDVIEGTCAFAMPGGPVARNAYEALRDEILDQIKSAMPLDLIALGLHGAMMADGYLDCEGDLLAHVRAAVGPHVAVGAVFDLHAHLSAAMLANADVLIAFKDYPHTDFIDRSDELLALLAATRRGEIRPVMAMAKPGVLFGLNTTSEPGASMVARLRSAEADGILSASWIHGFPLGDSPDLGSAVLTIANGDPARAQQAADALAQSLIALAKSLPPRPPTQPLDAQISDALSGARPIVLVDSADQPGGGGGGDNVEAIQALLAMGIGHVACGPIYDPQAVGFCFDAGAGAGISLRLGGKTGPDAGPPLDIDGTVLGVAEGMTQRLGEARVPIGDVAAVEAKGVAILLTSLRDQAYDPDLFRAVGIEPATREVLLLKSSEQFRIGFGDLAGSIVHLRRGAAFTERRYVNRPRPLWPFEALAQ